MRVVHVVCTDAFAGVERHIAVLARGQRSSGHQVVVIGGDPARMAAALGEGIAWRSGATVASAIRQLSGIRRADVVHAHMTAAETAAVITSPRTGAAIVATRHFARGRGSNQWVRRLTAVTSRRVDAQISISRYVADSIDGHSVVVHPGVEPVDCDASQKRRPVVLMAQRLEREKRTDTGIRVFASSGIASQGWQLWIAGEGSERAGTEKLVSELGIAESCTFLGARNDVADLYATTSILLAPCPIDGLGLSVVEAMSARLPVVAAAAGGHLETVGAVDDSVTYEPDDPAEGGRRLAALVSDAGVRVSYGDRLHELQRARFAVPRQVEQTNAVYRSVL